MVKDVYRKRVFNMIYIESPSTDPAFNLALEQHVFESFDRSEDYFMLWRNDNTIVIGKNQNTFAEINPAFVREHRIKVVRRMTGGGAVYHDLGNLNFSFITEAEDMSRFDFSMFCRPVVAALGTLGVHAEVSGRNDMLIDGKKFSGNSQMAARGRVLHHGTMMYDSDLSVLSRALQVSEDKIRSKGLASVRSRVTNIIDYMPEKLPLADFWHALLCAMYGGNAPESYVLTAEDLARVEEIKKSRYDRWEWNYGASPEYDIVKKRRVEGVGSIELHADVKNGVLEKAHFYGDFFGRKDPAELAERLVGVPMRYEDVALRLQDAEVTEYFSGLSVEMLLSIILD